PWAVIYMDRTYFLVMQGVMSLALLAAPISFLLTVHERGDRWSLGSVGRVVAGLCLGIGLMVNNTVGQIQGFFLREGEFVRTPKGWQSRDAATSRARPYASPLHWTFFVELGVLAYCLLGSTLLMARGEALWALPLVFWGMCLGLVARLQLTPQPA
ncbi:MAG TPA: hypothetical protein VJ997_04620, partial [Longimicrobiales bacterium]|nr:hypothetical protein [Longimicrobiales bacterium]